MNDWTGGYAAQGRYQDTIQAYTRPLMMDAGLLVAGRAVPHEEGKFRYGELGCGAGFGMIATAAAYPEAQFEGYDFMPEHIVRGRRMIADAGLSNVNIHEASFEELAKAAPPEPFDYLILHGVWSWVSEENQAYLTQILGSWLKPGGVAYLGYSSAAGWLQVAPIRRLFQEAPRGSGEEGKYGPARAAATAFAELHAGSMPAFFWEKFKDLPDQYIDHDFGSVGASAEWHPDLCTKLAQAKLEYVCPADLLEQFPPLFYADEQIAFVGKGMAEGWGETAKDLAFERTFRTDLFARGAPHLRSGQAWRTLKNMTIAEWTPRLQTESVSGKLRDWPIEVLQGVRQALGEGEQTIGDFLAKIEGPEKDALQLALVSVARSEARIIRPRDEAKQAQDSVDAFNAVIKQGWQDGESYPGIASARIGGPVSLSQEEKGAFGQTGSGDAEINAALTRLQTY